MQELVQLLLRLPVTAVHVVAILPVVTIAVHLLVPAVHLPAVTIVVRLPVPHLLHRQVEVIHQAAVAGVLLEAAVIHPAEAVVAAVGVLRLPEVVVEGKQNN